MGVKLHWPAKQNLAPC